MIDYITVAAIRWINLMESKRNTTQKDPTTKEIKEEGMPRCRNCLSRMSVVEIEGKQKLWCFHCDSQRLGGY